MNVKYFDLLIAGVLALLVFVLASFQGGCHWEEPVDVHAPGFDAMSDQTRQPPELALPPEVMVVECDNGDAHAYYPGYSREELASIHAIGHLLAQPGDYLHRQASAYVVTGEAWVDCAAEGFDYVTFVLR